MNEVTALRDLKLPTFCQYSATVIRMDGSETTIRVLGLSLSDAKAAAFEHAIERGLSPRYVVDVEPAEGGAL